MFKPNFPLATRPAQFRTSADLPCRFRQPIAPKQINFNAEYLNP
jgi:hypothetical protein